LDKTLPGMGSWAKLEEGGSVGKPRYENKGERRRTLFLFWFPNVPEVGGADLEAARLLFHGYPSPGCAEGKRKKMKGQSQRGTGGRPNWLTLSGLRPQFKAGSAGRILIQRKIFS